MGVVRRRRRARHHQEGVGGEPGHGQVRLDAAAGVQHLRIDQAAGRHVDVVGAEPLEHRERVGALETELAERGLVEEPDRFTHGAVLVRRARKPVLATVAVAVGRFHPRLRVPVGALPAHHDTEARATGREPIVQHARANAARGQRLQERPVHRVEGAHHLHRAVAQVARVALEWRHPPDVDVPEIHRRLAAHDPLGHRAARARSRRDADGVEAGRDEEVAALRSLAQEIAAVGREALRPVDVTAHRRALERGNADQRLLHQDLKVLPVLGQQ